MSYPINQNIKPYSQTSMGIGNSSTPIVDADSIRQGIAQNSILNSSGDGSENGLFSWKTFAISLPVWIGMCFGVDKFGKACGGDNSLLHRLSQKGDDLAEKVKPLETIARTISETKTNFMKNFVTPKHKILYAFFKTAAKPENSTAKSTEAGPIAEIASDAIDKFKKHKECGGTLTLNSKNLTLADLDEMSKKSYTEEGINDIIKICKENANVSDIMAIKKAGKIPFTDKYLTDVIPFTKKVLLREFHFSEFPNKINTLRSTLKESSNLGKILPKAAIRGVGGLAQGMNGGKIGILLAAYFIAEAIKKGIEAPKGHGEKRKTFTESFVYNIGFFLTMPLAAKLMYHTGGLKYLGMTDEQVKEYRNILTDLNSKVDAGTISKEGYQDIVKNKLKPLLKGDLDKLENKSFGTKVGKGLKNAIYKPLKLAGKLWDIGLENIKPYIGKDANILERFMKKIPFNVKRGSGFVLRFALFNFVISNFLAKLCVKGSDAIFGKPSKSLLDDESKKSNKDLPKLVMPNQNVASQVAMPNLTQLTQQNGALQPVQQAEKLDYNPNPQTSETQGKDLTSTYSEKRNIISKPNEPVRTYVPSSDGVKVSTELTEEQKKKYNEAMAKSINAEKSGQKRTKKKN